jgi:RNA polymerase sigma-70 factor (ECF subfamily)
LPEPTLPRIARGDRAAVRECLSRHGGLVWSLARRWSEGREEAEDAVQEIFLALWTHAGRFDSSIASETTFVAMIARRTLIDRRRKQARRPPAGPLPDDLGGAEPGPSEWLEQRDEAARALRALETLGEDQRRVLTLSIQRGMTYDEIAGATGLPLGTVKTHARRALIQLRRTLGAPEARAIPSRNGGAS